MKDVELVERAHVDDASYDGRRVDGAYDVQRQTTPREPRPVDDPGVRQRHGSVLRVGRDELPERGEAAVHRLRGRAPDAHALARDLQSVPFVGVAGVRLAVGRTT